MIVDDDQFMRDPDALAWNMEHDPGLRSTFVAVAWLDGPPDIDVLTARLERATRQARRLRRKRRETRQPRVLQASQINRQTTLGVRCHDAQPKHSPHSELVQRSQIAIVQ